MTLGLVSFFLIRIVLMIFWAPAAGQLCVEGHGDTSVQPQRRITRNSSRKRPDRLADGAHIPLFVLKNYLDLVGIDKSIVVTDAMVASDLGPGNYHFGRWNLHIGDDLVARSPNGSHLVGSTVTMPRSFDNLTEGLGFSAEDALTLLAANPRIAIQNSLHRSEMISQ